MLVFQTEPLTEAVEVTGPMQVRLWISSSALDTDFTATPDNSPAAPSAAELVAIGASATLLEQVAFAGIDNLTVPLAVAALWQRLA